MTFLQRRKVGVKTEAKNKVCVRIKEKLFNEDPV